MIIISIFLFNFEPSCVLGLFFLPYGSKLMTIPQKRWYSQSDVWMDSFFSNSYQMLSPYAQEAQLSIPAYSTTLLYFLEITLECSFLLPLSELAAQPEKLHGHNPKAFFPCSPGLETFCFRSYFLIWFRLLPYFSKIQPQLTSHERAIGG